MRSEVVNKNKDNIFHGDYVGRDNITVNIVMFKDSEREFVVTHNADIKPVAYFTGRETELRELRQRVEEGRKSVLVSGMGGIGKTHICRKLFEEYLGKHARDGKCPFRHIGYVEYSGNMGGSLQSCLKFRQQEKREQNQEAAWKELEYLASDGKLLLFVDNVDRPIREDFGLQRLKGIPGAVVLTSRQASFSDEFEPYRIGFLGMEQCKEIYGKIRFEGSKEKGDSGEVEDLEYIIENLAGRHTITVEFLAHLARTKLWTVKKLREKLEKKGFRLTFHKGGELINIQKSYEKLYDLSALTEAEKNILEAFSVFPYIPLEAETCNEWLLADAGVSEDDDILMGLYQKGWLQFDTEQEGYALHPVFAQFIYEKCEPSLECHRGLTKECLAKLNEDNLDIFSEIGDAVVLFSKGIVEKLDMGKSEEQIGFLELVGDYLRRISKVEDSKMLCEKRIKICNELLGEYHVDTAFSYFELANCFQRQNEYKRAEELYKKSLRIYKKLFGEEHTSIFTIWYNLICIYDKQGEEEKVDKLLKKFIEVQENSSIELDLYIRGYYKDLAELYLRQEKYEKAQELFERCLYDGCGICDVHDNLAYIYAKLDKKEKAQEVYRNILEECGKVMRKKYPDTAINYSSLGYVYNVQEEYSLALSYKFKAYKIWASELGIRDSMTQIAYEEIEQIYRDLNPKGKFDQWLEEKMKE